MGRTFGILLTLLGAFYVPYLASSQHHYRLQISDSGAASGAAAGGPPSWKLPSAGEANQAAESLKQKISGAVGQVFSGSNAGANDAGAASSAARSSSELPSAAKSTSGLTAGASGSSSSGSGSGAATADATRSSDESRYGASYPSRNPASSGNSPLDSSTSQYDSQSQFGGAQQANSSAYGAGAQPAGSGTSRSGATTGAGREFGLNGVRTPQSGGPALPGYASGQSTPGQFVAANPGNLTGAAPADPQTQAASLKSMPFDQVFRFDVTIGWITQQWPRVTTLTPEQNLQGFRVPVLTGTTESDLAGSLSYYFDARQQLDRIIFHGTTGDPRRIVYLATSKYHLERTVNDDPSVFIYRLSRHGYPESELQIRPAKVIRADAPRSRYEIDLAIKRPE